MANHPYVEEVTYTCGNAPVFTEQGDWYGSFYSYFCFDPNEAEPNSYNSVIVADKDFFSFFKLQLKAGSWPTDATPYSYMVNATCLQTLGYTDLLERPIYIKGKQAKPEFAVSSKTISTLRCNILYYRCSSPHTKIRW